MSKIENKRVNLWMPLLFSVVLIIGMVFGFKLNNSSSFKKSISSIIEYNRLEEIISLVENRYVNDVDEEKLYRDGINGILSGLDPHTFYIPVEEVATTNDNLRGNYKGIGLEYNIVEDTIVVISVTEDGPAAMAGIQIGDKILQINQSLLANVQVTMDEVRGILRNSPSDSISMQIKKWIDGQVHTVQLNRHDVHINSVDLATIMAPGIGYIRINKFSDATFKEFKDALAVLKPDGLESLILDLRQNGGGYLDAAVQILDEIFGETELLLSISGKSFNKESFRSTPGGSLTHAKIIVLIDETTASSSEIIAGAIQDWDRGLVIGRTSFGKGLVQEQFDLSDGSAIRLTIAKYYTPSGRSIQRNYSKGKEVYEAESEARYQTLRNWETQQESSSEVYYSKLYKRPLHSDIGIIPDVLVRYQEYMLSPNLWHVVNGLDNFVNSYFVAHLSDFVKYKNIETFNAQFTVSPAILQEFKTSINAVFSDNVASVWKSQAKLDYIKLHLKANFARLLFRNQGYYTVINAQNDIVNAAMKIAQDDKKYNSILQHFKN